LFLVVVYIPFDNPSKLVGSSHIGYNFPFLFIIFLLFTIIVKPSSLINCLPFSPISDFALSCCPLQLTTLFNCILFVYLGTNGKSIAKRNQYMEKGKAEGNTQP